MPNGIHSISWPGWETVRLIGRGSFGMVYEIQRDIQGNGDMEKAALKVITIPRDESEVEYLRVTGFSDNSITQNFHQQAGDIAPELYSGQPYGSRADIYSLGLMLYWLLNERRMPFLPLSPEIRKFSEEEKARQRRFSGEPLPTPKNGSDELKRIVLKACAYDPKDRYQSAQEMLDDLNAVVGTRVTPVPVPVPDPDPDPKPVPLPAPDPYPAKEETQGDGSTEKIGFHLRLRAL